MLHGWVPEVLAVCLGQVGRAEVYKGCGTLSFGRGTIQQSLRTPPWVWVIPGTASPAIPPSWAQFSVPPLTIPGPPHTPLWAPMGALCSVRHTPPILLV